jgi:hypothetical protein
MMDVIAQTAHHMYQGMAAALSWTSDNGLEKGNAVPLAGRVVAMKVTFSILSHFFCWQKHK